ncbi:LysR substrate-binding domain-containing protein [Bordetella petrii]|uniref:LysR substrate-binding domain-containing protein n=1 Tax=Bordetella petrii TaxID=94624 RepID=A0ABT7W9E3_9BORD|nr:LysR substrate-binding domain-containing protein [Bordetella petrii]MDM9561807.1 LysR substrate-binding domain-containing protein [Bordetella petrii]
MPGFDLEQLRTYTAVLDAGSLTAAAPIVHLSQSAVSEQVRKLEERAGQVLLVRTKAGVHATPAGLRLLAHARRILALSDEALRDLRGVPLQGELRLALTDYFRPRDIAGLLRRLNQQYPQVRLHVAILKSGEVEAACARGQFDLGVAMHVRAPGAAPRAPGVLLRREALWWMAAEGLQPDRDAPLPLLVLPETCALRQFTETVLIRRRLPYTVAHVASGVAGLQLALAAGLGVACLNESALAPGVARLARAGLPALPQAQFRLLSGAANNEFVVRAREAVAQALA